MNGEISCTLYCLVFIPHVKQLPFSGICAFWSEGWLDSHLFLSSSRSVMCPWCVQNTTVKTLCCKVKTFFYSNSLSVASIPVNDIRVCFKEFWRRCLHKEFVRECEGSVEGKRSMPKLHCCNIRHGSKSEKSHRWLVEMSASQPLLRTLTSWTFIQQCRG